MPQTLPSRPIVLYRHPLSGHCHRVEVFLRLLSLPFETVDVDLRAGAHKRPEFLALNPLGQVPVIDDDGTVLSDSNAILVYLAQRYAPAGWLPRDPVGAARVQRWLSLAAGPLAFGPAYARVVALFGLKADTAEAVARAHDLFRFMEQALGGEHAFLAADHPTLADLALYAYTARAPEGGVSLEDYPRLRGWMSRVAALPGFMPMPVTAVGLAA